MIRGKKECGRAARIGAYHRRQVEGAWGTGCILGHDYGGTLHEHTRSLSSFVLPVATNNHVYFPPIITATMNIITTNALSQGQAPSSSQSDAPSDDETRKSHARVLLAAAMNDHRFQSCEGDGLMRISFGETGKIDRKTGKGKGSGGGCFSVSPHNHGLRNESTLLIHMIGPTLNDIELLLEIEMYENCRVDV